MFRSQPSLRSDALQLAVFLTEADEPDAPLADTDLQSIAGGCGLPLDLEHEVFEAGRAFRADWRDSVRLGRHH